MRGTTMRIVAVSDLRGMLPAIPPCDLLLLGGDLCPVQNHRLPFQAEWLNTTFRAWLERQPARKVVGVAGNHDFVFERARFAVPADLPWTYLQDEATEWEGLKIYGSPWQPWFFDWAFNLYEDELEKKWRMIPAGTDILVLHGPPYGYGDGVPERGGSVRRCGSPSLLRRIEEVRPKLVIFGHIHEGRGEWRLGPTVLANVTLVNAGYEEAYSPWVFDLEM
jgi:Icc-related predicted phosphoesterase